VSTFGWVADEPYPPARWDLRLSGWTLCCAGRTASAECDFLLLVDARELTVAERRRLADNDRPSWRMIMLGVEDGRERADLLLHGCAEALPASVGLGELTARAARVDEMFSRLPRWRTLGPLTLDLFHRDVRCAGRWLSLHPREFGLLWRLTDQPGAAVTRIELLRDVWRIAREPETNSVEVHVSRLRSKLALSGCADLVETVAEGGYRVAAREPFMLAGKSAECAAEADQSAWTACPNRSRSR
jgi:two-component system OmpR family response regulator